ncbi:MAG TPA: nitroreductase family protein [Actinoplanes sp.]|nr:nitroreductase family protein [Actinoplanes sp.]
MSITDLMRTMTEAVRLAQHAPSVFNTQPWRWRVGSHTLDLLRDRARGLPVTDAQARQLLMSCGAALHHARIALAATGRQVTVTRLPDLPDSDLLARLEVGGRQEPDPRTRRLRGAIPRRRTDRRGFAATPVPDAALVCLSEAAETEGGSLYVVPPDQMPTLTAAAGQAAAAELADPAYRAQLTKWTNRPPGSGDGVPATTAAPRGPRAVPLRDFAPDARPGLQAGQGDDAGARYAILYGPEDNPLAWLRAGEALSAVLLTAVLEGIGSSPMSDVLEVREPRLLVRRLLPGGQPYLILRLGIPLLAEAPPLAPRRPAGEVVRFD